jgi:N-acyl-D-amino-acid deacylase
MIGCHLDTIIQSVKIVDGTGRPAKTGDVGIRGDKIVDIGNLGSNCANLVPATGLTLMPGIIDAHTHYDAQITWDNTLSPSSSLGVTTVVMGNCGFGIAPCPEEQREALLRNLSVVEGMNEKSLLEGTRWDFATFPEYLARLQDIKPFVNVATLIGHSTIRTAIMGPEASTRVKPTNEELNRMEHLVDEGLEAGAIGFASSFSPNHSGFNGLPMPSTIASDEEIFRLISSLKRKRKAFVVASGARAHPEYIEGMLKESGCPAFIVTVLAMHNDSDPSAALDYYEKAKEVSNRGQEIYIHANPHPLSFDFSLENPYPFFAHSAFDEIKKSNHEARLKIYKSKKFREKFRADLNIHNKGALFNGEWGKIELNEVPITRLAEEERVDPLSWFFDQNIKSQFIGKLFQNNDDAVEKLLKHPNALLALSDAGAHLEFLCDAGFGLYFLSHWVKKRNSFSIEEGIKKLTLDIAERYRIKDRGSIEIGKFADLVLFDESNLGLSNLKKIDDLPAGGYRMVRESSGIVGIWVNGTRTKDESGLIVNGAGPGRVLKEFNF